MDPALKNLQDEDETIFRQRRSRKKMLLRREYKETKAKYHEALVALDDLAEKMKRIERQLEGGNGAPRKPCNEGRANA